MSHQFFISDQLEPVLIQNDFESLAIRKFLYNSKTSFAEDDEPCRCFPRLDIDYFLGSKASIPCDCVEDVDGERTIVTKMRPSPYGRIPLKITKTGIGFIAGHLTKTWAGELLSTDPGCRGLSYKWVQQVVRRDLLLDHASENTENKD